MLRSIVQTDDRVCVLRVGLSACAEISGTRSCGVCRGCDRFVSSDNAWRYCTTAGECDCILIEMRMMKAEVTEALAVRGASLGARARFTTTSCGRSTTPCSLDASAGGKQSTTVAPYPTPTCLSRQRTLRRRCADGGHLLRRSFQPWERYICRYYFCGVGRGQGLTPGDRGRSGWGAKRTIHRYRHRVRRWREAAQKGRHIHGADESITEAEIVRVSAEMA